MTPTIQPHENLTIDRKRFSESSPPQRWDVVAFHPPPQTHAHESEVWIMRVVGLPNETVEIKEGTIWINGEHIGHPTRIENIRYLFVKEAPGITPQKLPFTINSDSVFVLGDNSSNARDGRYWGSLPLKNIVGKVVEK